jgi:phosphopantetheinyl transferase
VLGRLAAREAIRIVLRVSTLRRDLEVLTGARGEPIVGNDEAVRVSVSHTKGLAAACAWRDPRWSAGIDIERVRPTDILDSAYAFSRRERQLIGQLGDRPLAALVGWAVKEAAWKAVTLDGSGGPEAVEIVALDLGTGRAAVRAADRGLGSAQAQVGRIRAAGAEYVLAVAWVPRPVTGRTHPTIVLTSAKEEGYCLGTRDTSGCSREE